MQPEASEGELNLLIVREDRRHLTRNLGLSDHCGTILMHFGSQLKVHGPSLIFSLALYTYIFSKRRRYLLFLECLDFCGDT